MPLDPKIEYCCCQLLPINQGAYLITLHCFVHAAYVTGLIVTSYHRPKNTLLLYFTAGGHLCLVPVGVIAFWANLYENWRVARTSGFIMAILAIVNSILTSVYFSWYVHFKANSQLDKAFFWKTHDDWISSADLPFTFWHLFTFLLFPLNLLWFYYSRIMCKLAAVLKLKSK